MTPQADFFVVAALLPEREEEARRLLASMNRAPGEVNAHNDLVPFARFDRLHFARLFIIEDKTVEDVALYGQLPPTYPLYLAFAGEIDGDVERFLNEVATVAGAGLRRLFACCVEFSDDDLPAWLKARHVPAAASYVNWRGRTVVQAKEEEALYQAVQRYLAADASLVNAPPRAIHRRLRELIGRDLGAGTLTLTAPGPTPVAWQLRNLLHAVGGLVLLALLLLLSLPLLPWLRRLETTDPEHFVRTDDHSQALAAIEDHDVTNQFSAMGTLKPGGVRLWITRVVLLAIDWAARHVYTRGGLARVRTIHFARWVFLNDQRRVIFLSNYDGSLESYMDDFINKVWFGLNVVFSNGIGYPRTSWLVKGGCQDEQHFKIYLRRHQMPTQVWYHAHPGLTAVDMERNGRIRRGLETSAIGDRDLREWMALL